MSKIIGAVEIGTSQAKALIGEVGDAGSLSIVGMATRRNEGMRKGEIVDFRKAASAVHAALEEAEKVSLTEMVDKYPLERGVVDVVCYRVVAGEDSRHDILDDEIIKIDLNRPSQPRFVEVEQLIFQKDSI